MSIATASNAQVSELERNRTYVRYWLYFICFLIFVMVIVGGATRLTDSGLSITEWKPILGAIPPLTQADWLIALEKYRQIPEYQLINKGMSLDEFKFIYWWEWGHRFLGRIIGLAVLIPMVFFWATGRLETFMKPRLVALFILGGLQGAIGWWMVASGLVDRVDVSQYRLAVHLTLANILFAYCLWLARGLAPHSDSNASTSAAQFAPIVVLAIIGQIFLGALVAGLDAGLAFNDWPTMDGAIIPEGLWVQNPAWINLFENPKTVQFIHRIGAYLLLLLFVVQSLVVWNSSSGTPCKRRVGLILILGLAQATIGIMTLVLQVPLDWALVHQGGAVVVLGAAVAHWRAIKGPYATNPA